MHQCALIGSQTEALLWELRTVTFSFLLFSRIGNQNPPVLAQAQQNMQEFQPPNQFSPPSKHICKKIQFPRWLLCRKSTPDWDTHQKLGRELHHGDKKMCSSLQNLMWSRIFPVTADIKVMLCQMWLFLKQKTSLTIYAGCYSRGKPILFIIQGLEQEFHLISLFPTF